MSGKLYLLQAHPAAILAFDLATGSVQTVVGGLVGVPDGIQLDAAGRSIFWTSMGGMPVSGEDFLAADGSIERCDRDGTNHRTLLGAGAIVTPKQLQLHEPTDTLYWCDREGMALMCCRTDGSGHRILLRTGEWPEQAGDVMRHCVGIALDDRDGYLYWTQKGPPDGNRGRIFRIALDIVGGTVDGPSGAAKLLLDNLPEPIDLDIDYDRRQLYWTDRGHPKVNGNSLNRADMGPSGLINHKVLATGLNEGIGLALDWAGQRVFVSDLGGFLRVLSIPDGSFSIVHRFEGPLTGIAFED